MRHRVHYEDHHLVRLSISPDGHAHLYMHPAFRVSRNDMVSMVRHRRPICQGSRGAMYLNCRIRLSHDGRRKEGTYQTTGRQVRLRWCTGICILCCREGQAKEQP
jgi:hypothetical protein